ncbi:MAG: creatininase family protein [Armatimonadota bacterium]
MGWKWEEFTAPEFAEAVKQVDGTCVVPIGVIEKHGDHLPLGTDLLFVRDVTERAVAQEPAIVFPPYYLAQISEAQHCPGTVATPYQLQYEILEHTCNEIARNGMKKIILLNGHGGNEFFLPNFALSMLDKPRDYVVFIIRLGDYLHSTMQSEEWKAQMVSEFDSHGGEMETSLLMRINPNLVKMQAATNNGMRMNRLAHLPKVYTSVLWYADFPSHFAGDPTHATPEKGEFLLERFSAQVANIIKGIKADTETQRLAAEFYGRFQH